ncbi:MAG TPA: response regulator [Burkholderiales bacterium]|nr:response regulator [Burkholderiales bacterium]
MARKPLERVFCVEDDDDIRRILRLALERIGGMTVELVAEPADAITRMVEFAPDLVMLDWMLPGIDGPTLLKEMRRTPALASVPVVFATAKASPREMAELSALGAAGVISKPFAPKELPAKLRAIWERLGS